MSWKKAIWLDFLSQFNFTHHSVKSGKAHVLGDALSTEPNILKEESSSINHVTGAPERNMDYSGDQMFEATVSSLDGNFLKNFVKFQRVKRLIPFLSNYQRF